MELVADALADALVELVAVLAALVEALVELADALVELAAVLDELAELEAALLDWAEHAQPTIRNASAPTNAANAIFFMLPLPFRVSLTVVPYNRL